MARDCMVNVGQLVREERGDEDVVLVGFGSHRGSVIAGAGWGAPVERMTVPPAQEGSWEDVLHDGGEEDKLLIFADAEKVEDLLEPGGTAPSAWSTTLSTSVTATTCPPCYAAVTTPSCT
jgi:erythromycin esterase